MKILSVVRVVLILVAVVTHASMSAAAMSPQWVALWTEDLRFAVEALRAKHPDSLSSIDWAKIEEKTDELINRLPDLDHHEVIVELACIVAVVEDGHTRLTLPLDPGIGFMQGHSPTPEPALQDMVFHQFPLRVGVDSDGVWIRRIEKDHRDLLGGRIVAIDGHSIAEVRAAIAPTIRRDNEMQLLHHLPMHLVVPEILHARGVIASEDLAVFSVDGPDGQRSDVELRKVPEEVEIDWMDAGYRRNDFPLYRRDNDRNFWFEFLPDERMVYLQFNTVYDTDTETIRQFGERLVLLVKEKGATSLVIDLRHNRGGDQSLALPLLAAIERTGLARAGSLFAIIGRTTFSAAMTFSLELERHTPTIFVGEPTGSKPNHFGDSRKVRLPNSKLTLRISSLWWQWNPTDDRRWIRPHVAVELTSADYVDGRDPVFERILEFAPGAEVNSIAGSWRGVLTPIASEKASELTFVPAGNGWAATIDIPAFEIEGATLEKVAADNQEISFELPLGEQGVLRFSGRRTDDWIIGQAELGSYLYPIVVQRNDG